MNSGPTDPARKGWPVEQHREAAMLRFFRDGRLTVMPAKRKSRLLVLAIVAGCFDEERIYSENEVNQMLQRFHDDFCYLRRELVDEGFLERSRSGLEYRKAAQLDESSPQ
jgi:ArsR family transcriptional regulator